MELVETPDRVQSTAPDLEGRNTWPVIVMLLEVVTRCFNTCSSSSVVVCDSNVVIVKEYNTAAGKDTLLLTILFHNLSTVFLPVTCKSLFSPAHPLCLSLPCCPEKSVSVLLDLLFQFITQPPFTMTHASCQSPWPVWEPATAVQSFTCWTMVRGGMSHGSRPLHWHLLVVFTVWQWCNKGGRGDNWVVFGLAVGLMSHLAC